MRDHFSLDLYSILISWEFIMSVCGNQSCMRVNYDFVSQNETLALSLYRLHCHTCKKIFFKWHFHSMHLNKDFLFFSFSKLSSPCFMAKEEMFCSKLWKKKKKSQQKTLWEAGVKSAPVILLWQSKRWGNSERLDGAQIDESHTHTTQHHRATPDGTHQLFTFHKLFFPGVNTSSCWHNSPLFHFNS